MKIVLALLVASTSTAAMADQFYLTVGLDCNRIKSELIVSFRGAWNEEGEKAISALGKDGVDPRKLVVTTESLDGKYSYRTKTKTLVCVLAKHKYKVEISPLMAPGFSPAGFCGARIGANVVVRLNNKILAREGVDACTEKGSITTAIAIKPNQLPAYEKVAAEQFYGS